MLVIAQPYAWFYAPVSNGRSWNCQTGWLEMSIHMVYMN